MALFARSSKQNPLRMKLKRRKRKYSLMHICIPHIGMLSDCAYSNHSVISRSILRFSNQKKNIIYLESNDDLRIRVEISKLQNLISYLIFCIYLSLPSLLTSSAYLFSSFQILILHSCFIKCGVLICITTNLLPFAIDIWLRFKVTRQRHPNLIFLAA